MEGEPGGIRTLVRAIRMAGGGQRDAADDDAAGRAANVTVSPR